MSIVFMSLYFPGPGFHRPRENGWKPLSLTQYGSGCGAWVLDSNELKAKQLSDNDYLDILYRTLLNREPDSKGKGEWLTVIDMGVSRNYLIYNFVASPEFGELCSQYGIERGSITLTESRDQNKYITGFV